MNSIDANTKSEVQLRVIMMAMAAVVMLMSFAMNVVGATAVYLPGMEIPLPESCGSRLAFGVDCPACGMTRAFISISHGRFYDAWRFNPASFLTYLFIFIQLPWHGYQLYRMRRNQRRIDAIWIYYLPMAVLAAMLCQWLVKVSGIFA